MIKNVFPSCQSHFQAISFASPRHYQYSFLPLSGTCKESYIGETERSLKARFLEHRRPSSSSSEVSQHIHIESPGHHINLDKVEILDREERYFERGVKEAIYIRALQPSLNRDGGRYKLPRVYDPVLRRYVTSGRVQKGHIPEEG